MPAPVTAKTMPPVGATASAVTALAAPSGSGSRAGCQEAPPSVLRSTPSLAA